MTVRNPWPGQSVTVVDGTGATVATTQTSGTFSLSVAGRRVVRHPTHFRADHVLPFAAVGGTPAATPKTLNGRSIGLTK